MNQDEVTAYHYFDKILDEADRSKQYKMLEELIDECVLEVKRQMVADQGRIIAALLQMAPRARKAAMEHLVGHVEKLMGQLGQEL